MRRPIAVLVWSLLVILPGFAAARTGGPEALSDGRGQDGAPWLIAQSPPAQPSPGPQPPRPPQGMGPGGAWWRNSEVAKKLALADPQVAQIEKTFLERRLQLVDLRATLDKEELRLQPLLDAERPDEAKVAAQLDLIIAARGKLDKANALMLLAIRRTLTQDQWRTLQALQQQREGGRGRPGEGGPQPQPRRPGDGPPGREGRAGAPEGRPW